jgi:2-polyprenyl-6-methoxyphenol hydroxylase-like FAD-dependent oxidoreductase
MSRGSWRAATLAWVVVLSCALAPAAARAEKKRLLVVGGGPGGLAAAITARKRAAELGHDLDVVVFESRGEVGTRKNMIALTRQSLDNLSWLGAQLRSGDTVQYLDRRTKVADSGSESRGPRLAPVVLDPRKVSGRVKEVLRQKNIATMPINGMEAELRREAAALGIEIRYRSAVEDVRDVEGGVELVVREGDKVTSEAGWMVVMAHGGDKLSAHRSAVPERPRSIPVPGETPSLLERIGVVSRTDETIGSRMVARLFPHTGQREIRNRYLQVAGGPPGRRTHHVRLDGPEQAGVTALLSELPTGPVDTDAWSREQARALGIGGEPLGAAEEFYLALTSARSAADPSRRIAVVMDRGATGAKILVGESLRKSTPLTGKAAQIALSDGIDAGETIAGAIAAGGDITRERALLRRYEHARVRATESLQKAALGEFHESGIEPYRPARQRSLRRIDELRTRVRVKARIRTARRRTAPARRAARGRPRP